MPAIPALEATSPIGERVVIHPPDVTPDVCPICHQSGTMQRLNGLCIRFREGSGRGEILQVPYRCPRHRCGVMFVAEYDRRDNQYVPNVTWHGCRLYPSDHQPPTVPDEIRAISPQFYGLYSQAAAACHHGLNDLHGMALRKAFEFLIKDYCISKHPGQDAAIKKTMLGPVINNYVSDPNIKACAERATWLGNDETHYERRWTGHDVTDLQTLVQLTLNWITNELLTTKYLASMPKPSP